MKSSLLPALCATAFMFLGMLIERHLISPDGVETKVVEIDVKTFPHEMSLGFHNPMTGSLAAMHCTTSVEEDYDVDMSVFSELRVQGYACTRISPTDL